MTKIVFLGRTTIAVWKHKTCDVLGDQTSAVLRDLGKMRTLILKPCLDYTRGTLNESLLHL